MVCNECVAEDLGIQWKKVEAGKRKAPRLRRKLRHAPSPATDGRFAEVLRDVASSKVAAEVVRGMKEALMGFNPIGAASDVFEKRSSNDWLLCYGLGRYSDESFDRKSVFLRQLALAEVIASNLGLPPSQTLVSDPVMTGEDCAFVRSNSQLRPHLPGDEDVVYDGELFLALPRSLVSALRSESLPGSGQVTGPRVIVFMPHCDMYLYGDAFCIRARWPLIETMIVLGNDLSLYDNNLRFEQWVCDNEPDNRTLQAANNLISALRSREVCSKRICNADSEICDDDDDNAFTDLAITVINVR